MITVGQLLELSCIAAEHGVDPNDLEVRIYESDSFASGPNERIALSEPRLTRYIDSNWVIYVKPENIPQRSGDLDG